MSLPRGKRQPLGKLERREEREFYLYILPWIIGFVLFGAGPIVISLALSFTEWNLLSPAKLVGLANFKTMAADRFAWVALMNTLYYGIASVFLGVVVSFLLALLLNRRCLANHCFAPFFTCRHVVSGIAVALLWINIFNPDFGLLNQFLRTIGIQDPPGWLVSPQWAMPALILMSVWSSGGSMVIYLAGLPSIPEHLYEAAAIDGAGAWSKFWNVTAPMMSPIIFFT